MVLRHLFFSFAFLLTVIAAPHSAEADPITVTFTAFPAPGDPVNTGPSTGFFTFDSSLIPEGGGTIFHDSGLGASEINFNWGRTLWTTANADLGELRFSPSGELLAWILGDSPGIWTWTYAPAAVVVDEIFVLAFAGDTQRIGYTNAGYEGLLIGALFTESVAPPIPEPSTMVLIASGAALIARARRRRIRNVA